MSLIQERAKNIIWAYVLIFAPMWAVYFLSFKVFSLSFFSFLGIHPRNLQFSEFLGVIGSWLVHGNKEHIINNSIGLIGLIFFVALFENKVFKLFFFLILTSGLSTWLLGAPHSIHFGASGLLFAIFGYILGSALTGRRWIYLIPIVAAFMYYGIGYYESFLNGLMIKEEVSFAAHFGGLLSGILVGVYFEKEQRKESTPLKYGKKSLKDKWNDFKWDMNYKLKQLRK